MNMSIGIIARDDAFARFLVSSIKQKLVEGTYDLAKPVYLDRGEISDVIQKTAQAIDPTWDLVFLEANLATPGRGPTFNADFFSGYPSKVFELFYFETTTQPGQTVNDMDAAKATYPENVLGIFVKPKVDLDDVFTQAMDFFGSAKTVELKSDVIPAERTSANEPRVSAPTPGKVLNKVVQTEKELGVTDGSKPLFRPPAATSGDDPITGITEPDGDNDAGDGIP